jgi:hypothetical protein
MEWKMTSVLSSRSFAEEVEKAETKKTARGPLLRIKNTDEG